MRHEFHPIESVERAKGGRGGGWKAWKGEKGEKLAAGLRRCDRARDSHSVAQGTVE